MTGPRESTRVLAAHLFDAILDRQYPLGSKGVPQYDNCPATRQELADEITIRYGKPVSEAMVDNVLAFIRDNHDEVGLLVPYKGSRSSERFVVIDPDQGASLEGVNMARNGVMIQMKKCVTTITRSVNQLDIVARSCGNATLANTIMVASSAFRGALMPLQMVVDHYEVERSAEVNAA